MLFTRNEVSMRDFSKTAKTAFARPDVWQVEIPVENAPAQHATVMQNFVEAILDGTPLIVPGEEGANSVEIQSAGRSCRSRGSRSPRSAGSSGGPTSGTP
jgi:hypothetical protein